MISMAELGNTLEALMRKTLVGDKQAYAALLQESVRLLRPYLMKHLSASSEVDDLLQEILLSVHKARHTYDGERPYKPWLYAIARFRLHDHLRVHYADQLRHAVDISEIENELHDDVTEMDLSYESIHAEIEKLPTRQAEILRLLHQQGYTTREVAQRMGMSESAVKVAAHRAYKLLRERIER